MKTKEQNLIDARDEFRVASIALAKSVLALQDAGGCESTIREVKLTIGDLACAAQALNVKLGGS